MPKKDKQIEVQGLKLNIDTDVFDDFDLIDALDQINEGNALRIAGALRAVCGEHFNEVREHLRDGETGRIPVESAAKFFTDLAQAVAPN